MSAITSLGGLLCNVHAARAACSLRSFMTLFVPLMPGNAPAVEKCWIQRSLPTEPAATIHISADSTLHLNTRFKGESSKGFPFLFDRNRPERLFNLSVSGEFETLDQFVHGVCDEK